MGSLSVTCVYKASLLVSGVVCVEGIIACNWCISDGSKSNLSVDFCLLYRFSCSLSSIFTLTKANIWVSRIKSSEMQLQMEFISRQQLLSILKGSIPTSSKKSYKIQREKWGKDRYKEGMGTKNSRERGNKVKKNAGWCLVFLHHILSWHLVTLVQGSP